MIGVHKDAILWIEHVKLLIFNLQPRFMRVAAVIAAARVSQSRIPLIAICKGRPVEASLVDRAFRYRQIPALLNPVLPMMPASVTMKMVGFPFF